MEFKIKTDNHGDETVQIINNLGDVVAEVIAVPVPSGGMSIDVRPVVQATVRNIVFGVSDMERSDDRFVFDTRYHNGSINDDCLPFVCVEVTPKA
jgi:hypothetical protein